MKLREYHQMKNPPAKEKKYFVIYARKSSEAEDRQASSIPDQVQILEELAHQKNLNILKVFSESKSAKAPDRSVFNEMIELIKSRGDIAGIVCWKLNRLSRNPVDTGSLQWLLQSSEINEIITPAQTYREVDSDFLMAVEGAQASRFIKDLRADTWRGLNSKLEKGWFPGEAPIGYVNNVSKPQGQRDIDAHPLYYTLMRKVFDLALTASFSLEELCSKSKDLGIRTK